MSEKAISKEQQKILDSQFSKDPNASNEKLRQLGIIINLPRNVVLKYFQQRRKWTDITTNFDKIRQDARVTKQKSNTRPARDSRTAIKTRSRTKYLLSRSKVEEVKVEIKVEEPNKRSLLRRSVPKLRSSLPKPDKWVFDDLALAPNDQFTTSTPKNRPAVATSTPKPTKMGKTDTEMKSSAKMLPIKLEFANDMNLSEIQKA